MKTINVVLVIFVFLIVVSCNNKNDQGASSNALLFDKACVKYAVRWDNNSVPNYIDGLNNSAYTEQMLDSVLSEKIKAFEFYMAGFPKDSLTFTDADNTENPITLKEAKRQLGEKFDTMPDKTIEKTEINKKEIKGFVFNEYWNFDGKKFIMTKTVSSVTPIRVYEVPAVPGNMLQSPVFAISCKEGKNYTELGKNIKYSVSLVNTPDSYNHGELTSPIGVEGINKGRLMWILLNNVLTGKKKAYDFFSQDKKQLSAAEIKYNLGYRIDSVQTTNPKTGNEETVVDTINYSRFELTGLYFIEDWYYDKDNFAIKKEVVAIGPMREYTTVAGTPAKTVPFLIYLKD
ncbi:MAG: hypothetical protein HY958_10685 [Bacteroidia bacterium]|nr:hypothetical protein [Bacteroidia bacterium]